ncbi:MAG: 50S ribosomal protein L17, partial [Chloroflexi bacterium RBG_13_57_8]
AKAKEVRGMAEKIITLGKKSGLHAYRQTLTFVTDTAVTRKVFADLGPRYKERPGGYTRVIKLEPRLGDNAPMVQIELIK